MLPAAVMLDVTMDYDSIAKAGSMLGSGAVIVMDDSRCMGRRLLRLSYFYQHESCGQCSRAAKARLAVRLGTASSTARVAHKI